VKVFDVGTDVKILWEAPFNHYSNIDAYQIKLMTNNDTYTEYKLRCDGSINPSVLSCLIPMLEIGPLTQMPLNSLIKVIVRARNFKGWSALSEPNIVGSLVKSLPSKMSPITIKLEEVFDTSILIRWTPLNQSQTGGVDITNYII
jgi:hypothetical protein